MAAEAPPPQERDQEGKDDGIPGKDDGPQNWWSPEVRAEDEKSHKRTSREENGDLPVEDGGFNALGKKKAPNPPHIGDCQAPVDGKNTKDDKASSSRDRAPSALKLRLIPGETSLLKAEGLSDTHVLKNDEAAGLTTAVDRAGAADSETKVPQSTVPSVVPSDRHRSTNANAQVTPTAKAPSDRNRSNEADINVSNLDAASTMTVASLTSGNCTVYPPDDNAHHPTAASSSGMGSKSPTVPAAGADGPAMMTKATRRGLPTTLGLDTKQMTAKSTPVPMELDDTGRSDEDALVPSKPDDGTENTVSAPIKESSPTIQIYDAVSSRLEGVGGATSEATQHTKKTEPQQQQQSNTTLDYLSTYLETYTPPLHHLDEDGIAIRMIKTNQEAANRCFRRRAEDPYWYHQFSSDEEDEVTKGGMMDGKIKEDPRGIEMAVEEVENEWISGSFFKECIASARVAAEDKPSVPEGQLFDKRTLNLVRRALGLGGSHGGHGHRHAPPTCWTIPPGEVVSKDDVDNTDPKGDHCMANGDGVGSQPLEGGDDVAGTQRRLTRGMARDTRNKRREEREVRENMGMSALAFAASEALEALPERVVRLVEEREERKRKEAIQAAKSPRLRRKRSVARRTIDANMEAIGPESEADKEEVRSLDSNYQSKDKDPQESVTTTGDSGWECSTIVGNDEPSSKKAEPSKKDPKGPQELIAIVPVAFKKTLYNKKKQQRRKRKRRDNAPQLSSMLDDDRDMDLKMKSVQVVILVGGKLYDRGKESRQKYASMSETSLFSNRHDRTKKRKLKEDALQDPKKSQEGSIDAAAGSGECFVKSDSATPLSKHAKKKGPAKGDAKGKQPFPNIASVPSTPAKKKSRPRHLPKRGGRAILAGNDFSSDRLLFDDINKSNDQNLLFEPLEDGMRRPISLSLLDWRRRQQWRNQQGEAPASKKSKGTQAVLSSVDESLIRGGDPTMVLCSSKKNRNATTVVVPDDLPSTAGKGKVVVADAGMTLWETIDPNPDPPKRPSTLEQPRRCHDDLTYATWCSRLINCLGGSGRSMARHEFFYGDIDRAWFNFCEFAVDLAKLGIPHGIKLTRSEWSIVRRSIPSRPKRFSERFVHTQMARLESYRRTVRSIQKSNTDPSEQANDFGYEVPAAIKVGATVTAFNKKARILHRGIVLSHDASRNGYLVQFERKELGYEFCPDTDVASHGVPEVMLPATEVALDGSYVGSFADPRSGPGTLPYGTTYGPLVDFHRRENELAIVRMANRKMTIPSVIRAPHPQIADTAKNSSQSNVQNSRKKESGDILNNKGAQDSHTCQPADCFTEQKKATMIEKIAERETLVKLMGTIDAMLLRKEMLLDALAQCHAAYQTHSNKLRRDGRSVYNDTWSFREHYAWLHTNLGLTNDSLEASLIHLQIMYGDCYAGRVKLIESEDELHRVMSIEKRIREKSCAFPGYNGVWTAWNAALFRACVEVGDELAAEVYDRVNASTEAEESVSGDGTAERLRVLESKAASAIRLLLTVYQTINAGKNYILHAGAWGEALAMDLRPIRPSVLPGVQTEVVGFDVVRQSGFDDLTGAVSLLHAEVAALKADSV